MVSPRSSASCCKAGPCISINERRVWRPARSRAVSAPIPLAAPVIRTLLPLRPHALPDIGIPFFSSFTSFTPFKRSQASRNRYRAETRMTAAWLSLLRVCTLCNGTQKLSGMIIQRNVQLSPHLPDHSRKGASPVFLEN